MQNGHLAMKNYANLSREPKKTQVTYFGQQVFLKCDGRCDKAWGATSRPTRWIDEETGDREFLTDDELGEAPLDPQTYEGDHAKPLNGKHNKWCARECERCTKERVQLCAPV